MHADPPLALHSSLAVAFFHPNSAARIVRGLKRVSDARTATADDESRPPEAIGKCEASRPSESASQTIVGLGVGLGAEVGILDCEYARGPQSKVPAIAIALCQNAAVRTTSW